jgi:hypothetical protein
LDFSLKVFTQEVIMNRWIAGWLFLLLLEGSAFGQPDMLWTRALGDSLVFWGGSIVETSDGVCVAGTWDMPQSWDSKPFMAKLTQTGTVVWTRVIEVAGSVLHDGLSNATSGGYYLAANFNHTGRAVFLNGNGDTLGTWLYDPTPVFQSVWAVSFETGANSHYLCTICAYSQMFGYCIEADVFNSIGTRVNGNFGCGVGVGDCVYDIEITSGTDIVWLLQFSESPGLRIGWESWYLSWLTNVQSS